MAMLPKVLVHEGVMRPKDRVGLDVRGRKNMRDWVNVRKMEQVREVCRATQGGCLSAGFELICVEDQVERFNDAATQIEELLLQSEQERVSCDERSLFVGSEFAEALVRIEMALKQVDALLAARTEGVFQDLLELDQAMRDDLVALTAVKVCFHLPDACVLTTYRMTLPMTYMSTSIRSSSFKVEYQQLHR
jgi:autophagy-related protein 11